MIRIRWRINVTLFALFWAGIVGLAAAQEKTVVILGTATPGGGFPVYGAAYSSTINEMDATLSVEPRNTKGSTENVPLIEAEKLDIGQVTG